MSAYYFYARALFSIDLACFYLSPKESQRPFRINSRLPVLNKYTVAVYLAFKAFLSRIVLIRLFFLIDRLSRPAL